MDKHSRNATIPVCLKLIVTMIFWGGTFIAGRVIGRTLDPFCAAFLRFLIASIFLLLLTWRYERHFPVLRKHEWLPVVLLGLTGIFLYNVLFFGGLKTVQAGRAAVIIAANPVFISLLSGLFFKEKLRFFQWAGILISVMGAVVVITRGQWRNLFDQGIQAGDWMIVGCVVCWVLYSIIGKRVMNGLSPRVTVLYSVLIGTAALAFPAFFRGLPAKAAAMGALQWAGLFYLGFFGTVLGFVWYYEGVQKIGPSLAGQYISFVPVSAVILGALLLGETVTVSLITGGLLVIGGVIIVNSFKR